MRKGTERLLEALFGLPVGRALKGALPGPLPIGQSLVMHAGSGVVLRDDFGLRFGGLGEALGQHLGNALMILLAGAPQQRLVGRVLDERVLEGVERLWWQSTLI